MNVPCDKLVLAESSGIRLIYCKNCNVVELEIGAISLRLNPVHAQQIANTMMKASLRLDRMTNLTEQLQSNQNSPLTVH
jgi:hypothetical protein